MKQTSTHTKLANPSFEKKANESVTPVTLFMAHSHKLEQPIKSTSKSVPHFIHSSSGNVKCNFVHNFDVASYRERIKGMHSS